MTGRRPIVAAFDVDGTLTTRDCVTPFLFRTVRVRAGLALLRHPRAVVSAPCIVTATASRRSSAPHSRASRGSARRRRRAFRRRDRTSLVARRHGGELAAPPGPRAPGRARVGLARALPPAIRGQPGRGGVVCTRLERGLDGRLNGRLEGPNCRGAEKAPRLEAWLVENGLAEATLWAYGDSAGDDELLARADHPVRVGSTRIGVEPL